MRPVLGLFYRHFTAASAASSFGPATTSELHRMDSLHVIINGAAQDLEDVDPRTSLLDLLRERLHLTGTKKGCDHGQCGACTVLVNGRRIDACLSLALTHDGDSIATIEGLAGGDTLHPVQAAFLEHDGFQCGYCTPGQICSAVGMLDEAGQGQPSFVSDDPDHVELSDAEIRERMSGNLCRCGAYVNIVAAIRDVVRQAPRE
ncbi:MAG: 2Fe-2S iron-sulfur cluster-binding protein [Rhodanobacteraceae bacterium]